jgi:hypothetical protein
MAVPSAAAQGKPQLKRPLDIPEEKLPEEKKPKKKVKGPRAVGLLQLTSSGKGTLIPVAILIDGKFYDASVYKADPIPMALESGTVYEAEQAGDSLGLFTISGALHSKTAGSSYPWLGAGSYLPQGTEAPKSTRKAEDVPVGLGTSSAGGDERPRLTRGSADKPAAASSPSPASGSGAPTGAGSSEKPGTAASSGQDAPKPAVAPASEKPADQSVKQQAPTAGQTPPAQASSGQAPQDQASQGQASQGQASEKNYVPTLRRGKPTQSPPSDDELATVDKPTTGRPDSTGTAGAGAAAPVKLVPAISDAGGPDPRPYKFYWKTGEEEERRDQMLALAADEVRAYASALARNRIPVKPPVPAKPPAAGRKAPAKPVQPLLENSQFRGFDVWATNQPVIILSADAHFPPAPGAAAPPEQYSITLVARTDIYGNLRKLYSGVTDSFHLDVTPRLELIDAVDADGDGRAELLFHETTDAGSGYVIYRPTADKLWKMFDSLAK